MPIGLLYESKDSSSGMFAPLHAGDTVTATEKHLYPTINQTVRVEVSSIVTTMTTNEAMTGNVPTTTSINQLEGIVQKRLNIKWVDAKRLIDDALRNCEITNPNGSSEIPMNRQDEIIEEACEIFADLTTTEQEQMRLPNNDDTTFTSKRDGSTTEPEWKRKARIQAERREAEWQLQQNIQQNQDKIQTLLKEKQNIIPAEEIPLTTIKSIRVIDSDSHNNKTMEQPPKESVPIVRIHRTTCYCIIQ